MRKVGFVAGQHLKKGMLFGDKGDVQPRYIVTNARARGGKPFVVFKRLGECTKYSLYIPDSHARYFLGAELYPIFE